MPAANRTRSASLTGYRAGTCTTRVAGTSSSATVTVAPVPVCRTVPRYRPTGTVAPVNGCGPRSAQVTPLGRNATTERVEVSRSAPAGTTSNRNGTSTGTADGASASASRTSSASVRVSSVSTRTHWPGRSSQYRLRRLAGATTTLRRVAALPRTCCRGSCAGPASKLGVRGPTPIVTSAPPAPPPTAAAASRRRGPRRCARSCTAASRRAPSGASSACRRSVPRTSSSTSVTVHLHGRSARQCAAQPGQRARGVRPYRRRRAAEHVGDLVVGEVVVEPQDQDRALGPGQAGEQGPHLVPRGELPGGIRARGPVRYLGGHRPAAGQAAPPGRELAGDRSPHVRLRRVQVLDARPAPVHPGKDLLHEVLGQMRVSTQKMRVPEQRRPTGDHELVEPVGHRPLLCQQLANAYDPEPGAVTFRSRRTIDSFVP